MIAWLDTSRAFALRMSFRAWPPVERVYRVRWSRLLTQFLLASVVMVPFAIALPIVPLIAGPFIAGPAHLVSSARVVSRSSLGWVFLASILGAVAVSVLGERSLIALVLGAALFLRSWRALILALSISLVAWSSLFTAAMIAMFAHNFVGFVFWWRSARSRNERLTVAIVIGIVVLMSAFIALGFFDRWLWLSDINQFVPEDLTRVAPLRWLSVFAFNQSVHYFVWLKAIPETRLAGEVPPSFRLRWLSFSKSVGASIAVGIAVVCGAWIAWALIDWPSARAAYLIASSFHGWLEIAAL